MMTDAEAEMVRENQCPACKNWGFIPGPRGGAGQNIYCANPACRAAFNVAPRHDICFCERVGEAPEHYYPPKVHILHHGLPLCNFAGSMMVLERDVIRAELVARCRCLPNQYSIPYTPDMWPIGHSWVGPDQFKLATCKECRKRAQKHLPRGALRS